MNGSSFLQLDWITLNNSSLQNTVHSPQYSAPSSPPRPPVSCWHCLDIHLTGDEGRHPHGYKEFSRDHAMGVAKVKVCNIHCCPLNTSSATYHRTWSRLPLVDFHEHKATVSFRMKVWLHHVRAKQCQVNLGKEVTSSFLGSSTWKQSE